MIFKRENFSDWVIRLIDKDADSEDDVWAEDPDVAENGMFGAIGDFREFSGRFGTGMYKNKQVEEFHLLLNDSEWIALSVYIFKNGDVETTCSLPANIVVSHRKKEVLITPLAHCSIGPKGQVMLEMDHEGY